VTGPPARTRRLWLERLLFAFGCFVLLGGCEKAREDLKAAKKSAEEAEQRLGELKARQPTLAAERAKLLKEREERQQQLAAVEPGYGLALAAAAYLNDEELAAAYGQTMPAARDGYLFQAAAAKGERAGLEALVAQYAQAQRACPKSGEEERVPEEEPCVSQPYEDACQYVERTLEVMPQWSCLDVVAHQGVPSSVFCAGLVTYPPGASYATSSMRTSTELVRVAFLDGELRVSDYPAPDDAVFNAENREALDACEAENAVNACTHGCDVEYGRYTDPCDPEPDYGCEGCGDGDYEEGEGSEESEEVRAARLAAEEAEEAARLAQQEAERARQEVAYQECLAGCRPADPSEVPEPETQGEGEGEGEPAEPPPPPPLEADAVEVTTRLASSPAPGVYVVHVDERYFDDSLPETPLGQLSRTALLVDPNMATLLEKGEIGTAGKPRLDALQHLGEAEDERLQDPEEVKDDEGKGVDFYSPVAHEGPGVTWLELPEGKVLAFARPRLVGYRFGSTKGAPPYTPVPAEVLCPALSISETTPQAFIRACAALAAADGGVSDGGAQDSDGGLDGGTRELGTDAGVALPAAVASPDAGVASVGGDL